MYTALYKERFCILTQSGVRPFSTGLALPTASEVKQRHDTDYLFCFVHIKEINFIYSKIDLSCLQPGRCLCLTGHACTHQWFCDLQVCELVPWVQILDVVESESMY